MFQCLVECETAKIVLVVCQIPVTESDRQVFGRRVNIAVGSFLSPSQLLGIENIPSSGYIRLYQIDIAVRVSLFNQSCCRAESVKVYGRNGGGLWLVAFSLNASGKRFNLRILFRFLPVCISLELRISTLLYRPSKPHCVTVSTTTEADCFRPCASPYVQG